MDRWAVSRSEAEILLKFECGAVIKTYCGPTIKADLHDCRDKEEPQGVVEMSAYITAFYSKSSGARDDCIH